uniref:Protein kinase domain-containing protein n=1 Tax=Acrobeloides nanus TaxID=290746 RepID=A0A914DQV6_9BILA
MDFIIDLVKAQKQLSPEEIEDLKGKRDEFTIPKKKLKIYYEMPLGDGARSTLYKLGFIFGKSPLAISTNLIETQHFQDCKVAVKVPTVFGSDESEQLFREIDTMKKIGYHKNVICMLGVCVLDEKPVVAFELADKDLLEYVQTLKETRTENSYFSSKIFFSILWQIAKGMEFIASKLIVHRDLAARNILLTDSFNAKISDFGLSCSIDNSALNEEYLPKKLSVKWLSIEALVSKVFSEKSDVWAFGVLMFEVFSFGQIPYPDLGLKDLMEYLTAGNRLGCPQAATEEIYEIMMECWKGDPEGRPTFETLANVFHEILEKATKSDDYESLMDE